MRDPVMIVQLQQMSDQEFLCNWLLEKCPVSGQSFGTNLDSEDNLVAQQLLMNFMGVDVYQKYDDTDFHQNYSALWNKEAKLFLPDEMVVCLPALRLGIHFCVNPPIFIKIAYDSPFRGEVLVGMAIDTLEMPGGPTYMQLGTRELVQLLQDFYEMEGHILTLKNTIATTMTKKLDKVEVSLPPGSLWASFKGKPPKVTKIQQ
jgi:hypothetical protein